MINIRKTREALGFSQEQISKELKMSRPSFSQIEEGKKELTIAGARKLAAIFSMSLEDFIVGKKEKILSAMKDKNEKEKIKSKEQEIRISVPQRNLKKFKEVLLYVLKKVGAKPNIGETAIYKLLYFIDFDFYEKYEKQLMGATYIKNHYGPTPNEFKSVVLAMSKSGEIEPVRSKYFQYEQKKYLPHREPNLSLLSAEEITHINDVLNRLSDKSAKELSNYSHTDTPWLIHEPGEVIGYESVFYRDHDHSVRNYDDEL